jgi:hypothetical protein
MPISDNGAATLNRYIPLAVLLISTALTEPAAAGSRSYHNANGSYAGSSITRNGYTTFTNRGGSYVGSSVTRGNTTTIYDARGSRAGSVTRTGRR